MAKRISPTVVYPLRGEAFDTHMAGWCGNDDCGKWRDTDGDNDWDTTQSRTVTNSSHRDQSDADLPGGHSTADTEGEDGNRKDTNTGESGETENKDTKTDGDGDDDSDSDSETMDSTEGIKSEMTTVSGAEGDDNETDGNENPTGCPDCGDAVAPADEYCSSCGRKLTTADDPDVLSACPACERVIEPTDNYCSACGEHLSPHRAGGAETRSGPETLVIATRGKELTVTDGDTIGRELRRIIIDTDGDEEQAVRIHREHVRFIRKNGRFYMINLGTNPTRLNGRPLEKGEQEPVESGDEIELSGVIGLVLRKP